MDLFNIVDRFDPSSESLANPYWSTLEMLAKQIGKGLFHIYVPICPPAFMTRVIKWVGSLDTLCSWVNLWISGEAIEPGHIIGGREYGLLWYLKTEGLRVEVIFQNQGFSDSHYLENLYLGKKKKKSW